MDHDVLLGKRREGTDVSSRVFQAGSRKDGDGHSLLYEELQQNLSNRAGRERFHLLMPKYKEKERE